MERNNSLMGGIIGEGFDPNSLDYSKVQQNALRNTAGPMALQNTARDLELRPLKDNTEALMYMINIAPSLNYASYQSERNRMISMGISPNVLPDRSFFESEAQKQQVSPDRYFDYWNANLFQTGMQKEAFRLKKAGEGWKPGTRQEAVDFAGEKAGAEAAAKEPYANELTTGKAKLIEFETATGTNPAARGTPAYEQAFKKYLRDTRESAGSNIFIGMDQNGNPLFSNTKGAPAVTPGTMPEGTTLGPKPAAGVSKEEAQKIGDEIIAGRQAPILQGFGMARVAPQVTAYLANKGFDLAQAQLDWKATERYVGSLNGTQQLRLRQAVSFAYESLDKVEELAKKWDAGPFPILNSANLKLAIGGALGKEAQTIATQLETQIADLTSELGTVYKSGNSSTDESLALAAKNLKAEWAYDQLMNNIELVRTNLQYRKNSLKNTGVAGVSAQSPYVKGRTADEGIATPTSAKQPVMNFDMDAINAELQRRKGGQ